MESQPAETTEGSPETSKPKKKKKGGKPLDLSQLDEKSFKIMAKLMLALMELDIPLYDFFEGAIYEQPVKTKKQQKSVEIINENNFYSLLKERGVRKKDTPHANLSHFLQLDQTYPDLLMLKRIAKTLDEMSKNDELMANIIAAAEEQMGGDDDDERLGTVEEDAESNQFETGIKGGNSQAARNGGTANDDDDDGQYKEDYEDDYEF